MNEIVSKFLLTGETFMSELHLQKLRFTYHSCGPFAKHRERIQKFKEKGDSNYVYKT